MDKKQPIGTDQPVQISVVNGLEAIGSSAWNDLWTRCEIKSVFARYEWAAAWVQTFVTKGQLRLYVATHFDQLVGILPFVWLGDENSALVLIGDEHADYAAILTDAQVPDVFDQLITAAARDLPKDGQLFMRDIRSDSSYASILSNKSSVFFSPFLCNGQTVCPRATLDDEHLAEILRKKSLQRHVRKLKTLGEVEVVHYSGSDDILPRLDGFFHQHINRRAVTDYPSLFLNTQNCDFYKRLVINFSETKLLVYTEILLDKKPLASHLGFISEHDLIWYKPSFDIKMAKSSPGEVLLYELFRFAGNNNLQGFDFTRGDEPFKWRFSNHSRHAMSFKIYGNNTNKVFFKLKLHLKNIIKSTLLKRKI